MEEELKRLKEIEKKFGTKFTLLNDQNFLTFTNGYVLDENEKITKLNLYFSNISDISFLEDFMDLTHLNLNNNRILDISALNKLNKLTHLYLDENNISDLSALKDLTNLIVLCLCNNRIFDISFLKNLKNLTDLDLRNNQISDISIFSEMENLRKLDLGTNKITGISSLKDLNHLVELSLRSNQVPDISPLGNLKKLKKLYLQDNKITEILVLKELENLASCDLKNNLITRLPKEVTEMNIDMKWVKTHFRAHNGVNLFSNPIETPPIEIVRKGNEAIKAYFKSLEGKKQTLNEVKVLLVGDGGAGKTSMVKRLLGEEFNINENKTHGININQWQVKQERNIIKVNIWDFGGQEIMHATHQFFLSKRSLYILVLDSRKDEKTEYWLKLIESFGGDSPVLLVINKIDENPAFDVNRKFLQEKYKNIKGFYRISCLTKEGVKNFLHNLSIELSKVELIKTTWGLNWFKIKKMLENMEEDFISYTQYKKICLEENLKEKSGQDTLVGFLNDLGVILHFKELELEDTHVLNPRWITNAVYKIINSGKLAESKGELDLALLDEILKPLEKDGYIYPYEKYKYIIDLMKKFELCYEINKNVVLIPDLLEVQEPDFQFDFKNALNFLIEYDFLPKSVMPRFLVKVHKDIKEQLRWRTGVVLENKAFRSIALVKLDEREKTVYINVNGGQKRDYFAVILHAFREINDSFEKLEFIEKVPMPDNTDIAVSYKHLIRLEDWGTKHYAPDGSEKEYDVNQLLGSVNVNVYIKMLGKLERDFYEISKLPPQERGYAFEKLLIRLFDAYELSPRDSFKNTGEQIDGSFRIGDVTYLVEAKWQKKLTPLADLLIFNEKVSGKATWTRGVFVSISGFTTEAIQAFSSGRPTSIIGMDGEDLEFILSRKITLSEAITLKSRYAAESNDFYYPLNKLVKKYRNINEKR